MREVNRCNGVQGSIQSGDDPLQVQGLWDPDIPSLRTREATSSLS